MSDDHKKNEQELATLRADKDEKVSQDQINNWLTRYYLHQDQMSWSRQQTIVAVEASILAATFFIDGKSHGVASWWTAAPIVFGSAIIFLLSLLTYRDWEIRDQDLKILDDVHIAYGIRMANATYIKGWIVGLVLIAVILCANAALGYFLVAYGFQSNSIGICEADRPPLLIRWGT
jgi:hypothetical protein